jgi:Holliday junction resolvasome RuvABC endonuclease subunit
MKIPILSCDPSFTAWGMARMLLDTDTLELELEELILTETEKTKEKRARVTSDDLSRATKLYNAFHKAAAGAQVVFSEVPSGAQDAKSARAFGIIVGILGGSPTPIVQVMPLETKAATGLGKTATKAEMIEWATAKYPHPGWLRARGKADGPLVAKNEHLADAIAVAEAGVLTDEFRRSLSLMRRAA